MPDLDLFGWWAISISFSSIFLTLVSIYLYADSRKRCENGEQEPVNVGNLVKNFMFVWVLLSLLVFYIVSIQIGSAAIFTAGNIVMEVILVIYLIRNRTKSE